MGEDRVCMSEEEMRWQKWYYWYRLPLLPIVRYRPETKHDVSSFSVHWLVFRAWTNIAPRLGVEINVDDNLSFRLNIPYLHTGIFIPILPTNVRQRFWRKKPWPGSDS